MLETHQTPPVEQYPHPWPKRPQNGLAEWNGGHVSEQPLAPKQPTNPAAATRDIFQFKLLYSLQEAAELLSISPRTLNRLIAGKELQVRRIGRRVLITRNALEQFSKRDHQTEVVH